MRLQARLTLAICAGLALASATCFSASWWFTERLLRETVEERLAAETNQFVAAIQDESRRALSLARFAGSVPVVAEAFAAGDRAKLGAVLIPAFDALRADGVEQFQFHLAPATSFLRLHAPGKYGDDLSAFRKTIVEANRIRGPVLGLESGVAGVGIRGITPVLHASRQVGTVEFGLGFGQDFVGKHSGRTGARVAVFLERDGILRSHASTFPEAFGFPAGSVEDARTSRVVTQSIAVDGRSSALAVQPLTDFSGASIGVLAVAVDRTDLDAIWSRAMAVFGTISLLMLALGAGIAAWLQRDIGRPLRALADSLTHLAAGRTDGRGLGRSPILEIEAMAGTVEVFRAALLAKQEAERAGRLETEAKGRRAETLDALFRAFEGNVADLGAGLSAAATEMEATARSMASAADETMRRSALVAGAAGEASSNVQAVASAAEELSASVREIAAQVAHSSCIADRAVADTRRTDAAILALARGTERIGDVITLINGIAAQTNLLALNATIEAARAGEFGRGFAVVAAEVKSLAAQTTQATTDVAAQVSEIQETTRSVIAAVKAIGGTIEEVSRTSTAVAAGVEEQGATTCEIARSVQDAAGGTREVTESMAAVREEAEHVGASASQVLGAAKELAMTSARLSDEVGSFLAAVKAA